MDNNDMVNKAKLYRLQKWQDNKKGGSDFVVGLVHSFCNKYGLDDNVSVKVMDLYNRVRDEGLLRGHSVEVGVACSVFISCRLEGLAYNLNDVLDVIHVDKKEVYRMYRNVRRELDLKIPLLSVGDYVSRYCSELDLGEGVKDRVMVYVGVGEKNGLDNGKNPLGLVGGAIYCACKDCGVGLTQRDVCDLVGVSEVVLRNRVRDLKECM